MNDALDTKEIKQRSISGAKWLVILNVSGVGLEYLTSVLLGRIGPETFGSYALARIIIALMASLIVLGGRSLLQNFMPKMQNSLMRGKLLISFGVTGATCIAIFVLLFGIFPNIFEFFIRDELTTKLYISFALMCVIVVTGEFLLGSLAGMMQIAASSIARFSRYAIPFSVVLVLYLNNKKFLGKYALEIMLLSFFAAYLITIVISLTLLLKDKRFGFSLGWHFPKGATRFYVAASFMTFFAFMYQQFDRIVVFGSDNLSGLGMYQAVITLVLLLEFVPKQLQQASVPMFSSLLASEKTDRFRMAYILLTRNSTIMIACLALIMIAFSRQLLSIFGTEYREYYYLLCMFCFGNVIRAPAFGAVGVLISKEKNCFRVTVSIMQIAFQVIATFALLPFFGILAIAGSKILGAIGATLANTIYVIYHLHMAPSFLSSYKCAIIITGFAVLLEIFVLPPGWVASFGLIIVTGSTFVFASRIDVKEVKTIIALMLRKQAGLSYSYCFEKEFRS